MEIRQLVKEDERELRTIHERYYKHEFTFEEFHDHFINMFAVTHDDGRIISAGGTRAICESVIVTDKGFSLRQRREALLKILQMSIFSARQAGFRELHATAQDLSWENILRKYEFADPKGKFLSLSLR